MVALQNLISLLLVVVAISAKADGYGRRKPIGNDFDVSVEDFDISNQRRLSTEDFGVEVFDVKDFDLSDRRRRPSVEDSDDKENMKMDVFQNVGTPRTPSLKERTKRRTIASSWSSWTFSPEPSFNFPTRNRVKTKIPRRQRKMPDDPVVTRIVIFPCQEENLRWKKMYFSFRFDEQSRFQNFHPFPVNLKPTILIIINLPPGVNIFLPTWKALTTANGKSHDSE